MLDLDSQDIAAWSDEDIVALYEVRAELRDYCERQYELEGKLYALAEKYGIPGLDGVKSSQTVALADKLGCSELAISNWWALTPPEWRCPTCGRDKSAIVRIDRNGHLMGQLVEHHDHLVDLLRDTFFRTYCGKRDSTANYVAQKFVERVQSAFTRFEAVIICGDCNTADAEAKKLVRAAKQFSFTPNELSAFVRARPNSALSIERDVLRRVYGEALSSFQKCVRVATEFAKLAADNAHWFQEVDMAITPNGIRRMADGRAAFFGLRLTSYQYALVPKNRKRGEHGWMTRPPRKAERPPTEKEVRYVADVQSSRIWQLVGDDWLCPVCRRSKVEIIRPTSQFPWNIGLFQHRFPNASAHVVICEDCEQTCRNLNRTARERGFLDCTDKLQITVSDLQGVIRAQPHGMHAIDSRAVDDLLLRPDRGMSMISDR